MIDARKLAEVVDSALENTDCFLTDLKISGSNDIIVEIDSDTSIDIDFCAALTRKIEEAFDRDIEDYTLEVGSAGLTAPFKVRRQWEKNLGNDIEVLTADGRKLHGRLDSITDADVAIIAVEQKVKTPGEKKPRLELVNLEIPIADVKRASYDLKF